MFNGKLGSGPNVADLCALDLARIRASRGLDLARSVMVHSMLISFQSPPSSCGHTTTVAAADEVRERRRPRGDRRGHGK